MGQNEALVEPLGERELEVLQLSPTAWLMWLVLSGRSPVDNALRKR